MRDYDLNDLRRDYGPNGCPTPPAVKLALEEMGQEIEERCAVLRQEAAACDEIAQPAPWVNTVLIGTGVLISVGVLSWMLYCVLEWLGEVR